MTVATQPHELGSGQELEVRAKREQALYCVLDVRRAFVQAGSCSIEAVDDLRPQSVGHSVPLRKPQPSAIAQNPPHIVEVDGPLFQEPEAPSDVRDGEVSGPSVGVAQGHRVVTNRYAVRRAA